MINDQTDRISQYLIYFKFLNTPIHLIHLNEIKLSLKHNPTSLATHVGKDFKYSNFNLKYYFIAEN